MEMRNRFGVLEMAEVLDGISDVKDVPTPIPGYQWRSGQSAKGRLRLINIVMFAHGDVRMTIVLRPHSDAFFSSQGVSFLCESLYGLLLNC
jgi:hypothetical protein